jgi:hypothetical protein
VSTTTNAGLVRLRLEALNKIIKDNKTEDEYDKECTAAHIALAEVVDSSAAKEMLQRLRNLKPDTATSDEWLEFFKQAQTYAEKCVKNSGLKSIGNDDLIPLSGAAFYKAGTTEEDTKKIDSCQKFLYDKASELEKEGEAFQMQFGIPNFNGVEGFSLITLTSSLIDAQQLITDYNTFFNGLSDKEISDFSDFKCNLTQSIGCIDNEIKRLQGKMETMFRSAKIIVLTNLKENLKTSKTCVENMTPVDFPIKKSSLLGSFQSYLNDANKQLPSYSNSFNKIVAKIADLLGIQICKNQAKETISSLQCCFFPPPKPPREKPASDGIPLDTLGKSANR